MRKLLTAAGALIASNFGGAMVGGCGDGDYSSPAQANDGGSVSPGDGSSSDGSSSDGSSSDGSPTDASTGGDGGDGGDGGFVARVFSLTIPPVTGTAGAENTKCITKRLGNMGVVHIGALHTTIASGTSAELIVYKVDDTVESTTPTECTPFAFMAKADGGTALTFTQKADEVLQFPSQDGFTFADNQMIRLELHAVDPTGAGFGATATFTTMPDSAYQQEVGMLVEGSVDVSINANQTAVLNQNLPAPSALAHAELIFLSGHQHQYGTALALGALDGGTTPLYDNASWNDPALTTCTPVLPIEAGGTFGLTCNWNNVSSATVKFGFAANDEQCFFRAHYAPATESQVCVHSQQVGTQDTCCPSASGICAQLFP